MSGLSFSFSKFLPTGASRERMPSDPLSHLRFVLETMPGSRKYVFTPATRAEILSELYEAFWGQYSHLFLPDTNASLPLHATLSEVQVAQDFCGAAQPDPVIPGRPCGRIFRKGETCYRCKDCATDDSVVMCLRCFRATDHSNHNVSFFIAQQPGGCCDCGDDEAWRESIGCPFHPPADGPSQDMRPTPPAEDYLAVKDYPFRIDVPQELQQTMRRTVGYALDFIIDTLDYSPEEPSVPANEAELCVQPSADPMTKDVFSIVLWNDDKHSYDEVAKVLRDLLGRSRDEASEILRNMEDNGREVIEMNSNATRMLEIAQTITQIDLGVTIRRAYDTFREQVVGVIIEWLLDLTRCRMGQDALILREIVAAELMSAQRKENISFASSTSNRLSLKDIPNPKRLDMLFLYHTRLWKKPRLSLKEIYASVVSISKEHKLAVAGHFANVYHRIIDAYLLVDREAETSIKYFALQLFTTPTVASHLARQHKIVTRILAIITSFFTNQIVDKRIVYPPAAGATIDVDSFPFKSKRFMPVFSDLRYLCHCEPVQQQIARNREYLAQFAKTCQLFMCVNPNKRAATNHVEYETDAWISVFNVTLSLSRVIKVYGEAFSHGGVAELIAAISTIIHHILMVCTLSEKRLDRTKFHPIAFHEVVFGGDSYNVIDFNVLEGWISFHHSLHWLLAELFKHVDLLSEQSLKAVGLTSVREVVLRYASEQAILTVIDFPLRVLAMIAQIRTGLWVRNGFAIRGQLLHYRDFMLRELCYDQDLFILQTAFIILDPETVLVTMLDRFGLTSYFSGVVTHPVYDGGQLGGMVEELLYVLITVLSENANASRLPIQAAVRREIVHALAMGPASFTDLVKRVAERLVDDTCFEGVLHEVANFKAPEATTDIGVYELRDECFDEVNPFFYHYTRNKREEVDQILRARLKKKTGQTDPVITPKPWGVGFGPFANLPVTFESDVLLQIVFYAVSNVLVLTETAGATPPSAEAILDQVLHMMMLAIVERPSVFAEKAVTKTFEEKNLLDVLCALERNDLYKTYRPRIDWILSRIEERGMSGEVARRRQAHEGTKPAEDPEEVKKRAAKARQEAIMKQMKAQQASFAVNFNDLDDDEDEDMEDATQETTSYGTCIVCQEDLNANKPFGALGLVQPSRFMRRHPDANPAYLNEVLQTPPSLDRPIQTKPPRFPPEEAFSRTPPPLPSPNLDAFQPSFTRFGLHSSVCSHMMHLECFQVYSVSIRQRHRAQTTRNHPESIPRKEYICPLCKSLGNAIFPVIDAQPTPVSPLPFPDWIRSASISILKSKPDPQLESLQFRNGTGEFVFWAAQDPAYSTAIRAADKPDAAETHKMLDTVMHICKSVSAQTRHLRDRPEPDAGERGAGIYLPEELLGYTIASMEIAQRGQQGTHAVVADCLSEPQARMIRGLLTCLQKLAALHLKGRPDEGREAVQHAIIKRLLPEWSRTSLTSFSYPLLLRDPFTVLVETAAIAPEMLQYVLVLTYYACLARTVIGLVYVLNKTRSVATMQLTRRAHEGIFGDVRMFFMSVVRHSPVFEHTATLVFETFGEARIERLLYAFTLPFLRRAAILCRAALPRQFVVPEGAGMSTECEYARLLSLLGIPPLADLPRQDTLQNALSGWCAHYGHSHAAAQLNCGVVLDYPVVYQLARLPAMLDTLFIDQERTMRCASCKMVPADAALCLLCGTACCLQSDCCKDTEGGGEHGECNMHMRECGGAIGVFFLVKRCAVLYLYANNGAFTPSPYLDAHGEMDSSMRRGRRQYLHHARWEDIRKIWLNHGIPTLIARKLESTVDSGGWETL
ncbi:hypothetical protein EV714DRAFT_205521 [Schizophyllum commune]